MHGMIDLRILWEELASRYTNDLALIEELWKDLHQHYTARKRHYHNLNHLEYMAGKALEYQDQLSDLDTVLFSIFYHDFIYRIKSSDNEQKSAEAAQERLTKLGVPVDKIARCQQQILATKAHGDNTDSDTNFLVDFDLAILGENPEAYQNYAHNIRAEYSVYPDFMYRNGRKKVLQHFLGMERIFKTDAFFKTFEQQARVNLKTELKQM